MNIEEQEKVLRNLFSSDISSLFKQKKEFEYSDCIWGTSVLFESYPFDMERKNLNILIAFGEHQSYLKFTLLIWKERILKEDES